jgi:hypothetical protein
MKKTKKRTAPRPQHPAKPRQAVIREITTSILEAVVGGGKVKIRPCNGNCGSG